MYLLSQFIEEMVTDLYSTYSRIRENQATSRQMLKIVLYSYMNHNYSSRAMEQSCYRDVNFIYLLEGSPVSDHSTFARFHSLHFSPCTETIMSISKKIRSCHLSSRQIMRYPKQENIKMI